MSLLFNPGKTLRLSVVFLIMISLFLITPLSPISADTDSIFTPYQKYILENGLTVIIKEVHSSPIVAIDIQVGTGAKNESINNAGISHFLEHMLFKGTERRKVGEIAKEITAVGGRLNGATSLDTTHYYVTLPSKYVDLALDIEADAIMNSTFDPEEIERERLVVLEEIRRRDDNNQSIMYSLGFNKLFAGTPYANDVLGTADTLQNINRDVFLDYYHKYYVPNNMAIAIVGDIDPDKTLAQIKLLFKDFKPNKIQPAPTFEIPKLTEITRFEIQKDVHQTYMCFGFPVPALSFSDRAALSVLTVLLGDSENSRLFKLYGKRLIRSIRAGFFNFQDGGLVGIYIETENKASVLERKVQPILKDLIADGVSDDELTIAKTLLKTRYAFRAENDYLLANIMSYSEVTGSVTDAIEFEQSIDKVTKEDIQRIAKEYLNPNGYILISLNTGEDNKNEK